MTLASLLFLAAASAPKNTMALPTQAHGSYKVTLRIPDGGLSAGEETDVEFRLVDTTRKDPYDGGPLGLATAQVDATLTMPSMPGMPEAKPSVHREGVPGDYGVVLEFPHGGDYELALRVQLPSEKPFTVKFAVTAGDQREGAKPPRYEVQLKPSAFVAGKQGVISARIFDRKANEVVTKFDVAHTKRFHLFALSQDERWFLHEHPVMDSAGNWTLPITFPYGGTFHIYGDVAPKDQGSHILATTIKVQGPPAPKTPKLRPNMGPVKDGTLTGRMSFPQGVSVGHATRVRTKLTTANGQPAHDILPYLGAGGHLMIFSEDGKTVVHSHPSEDATAQAQMKKGIIDFNARFPKPGIYRAFAQFLHHGAVRTLAFTVRIKE